MKALRKMQAARGLQMDTVGAFDRATDVLVRVKTASICGRLHIYGGTAVAGAHQAAGDAGA